MSLIFEALKKLEREKQAPERGILVVGPTQWAGGGARVRLGVVVAGAVALVGLGVAIGVALRRSEAPTSPAPPAPAPVPAVLPVAPPAAHASSLDLGAAGPRSAAPQAIPVAVPPRPAPAPVAVAETPLPEPVRPQGLVLALQAVTEQEGIPVALINDRLMRVGDSFDGVKVLSITAGAVEVQIEATGERRTLTF